MKKNVSTVSCSFQTYNLVSEPEFLGKQLAPNSFVITSMCLDQRDCTNVVTVQKAKFLRSNSQISRYRHLIAVNVAPDWPNRFFINATHIYSTCCQRIPLVDAESCVGKF